MPFNMKEKLIRDLIYIYPKISIYDCSLSKNYFKVNVMQVA